MSYLGDLGVWVQRPTEQFPGAAAAVDIFTIAGGPVLLTSLIGVVTTVMNNPTGTTLQLQHNGTANLTVLSTAGTGVDLDDVDTVYSIDGVFGNAVVKIESLTTGAAAVGRMTNGVVMIPGEIQFLPGAINTGWVAWSVCYIPLVDGATIVIA